MARSASAIAAREADDRPAGVAHLVRRIRLKLDDVTAALRDDVLDHPGDQAAHQLVGVAAGLEARMLRRDLAQDLVEQRQAAKLLDAEHLGAQAIVDVVGVVGDVVGDGAALRLGARIAPELEIMRRANSRR